MRGPVRSWDPHRGKGPRAPGGRAGPAGARGHSLPHRVRRRRRRATPTLPPGRPARAPTCRAPPARPGPAPGPRRTRRRKRGDAAAFRDPRPARPPPARAASERRTPRGSARKAPPEDEEGGSPALTFPCPRGGLSQLPPPPPRIPDPARPPPSLVRNAPGRAGRPGPGAARARGQGPGGRGCSLPCGALRPPPAPPARSRGPRPHTWSPRRRHRPGHTPQVSAPRPGTGFHTEDPEDSDTKPTPLPNTFRTSSQHTEIRCVSTDEQQTIWKKKENDPMTTASKTTKHSGRHFTREVNAANRKAQMKETEDTNKCKATLRAGIRRINAHCCQ